MDSNKYNAKVTREQVRNAYVFLLGREPESEMAYQVHLHLSNVFELRSSILASDEYRSRLRSIVSAYQRDAVVFIHLEKTGGTTLHKVLAFNYPETCVSPPHYSYINIFHTNDSAYDYYSGHFDYETASSVPRAKLKLISMLRDPKARLISQYRFWRSHPVNGTVDNTHQHVLAKELGPQEFFAHPAVRMLPMIDNYYFRVFGSSLKGLFTQLTSEEETKTLDIAMGRICRLDGLGITDRMTESVELICRSLGFPVPSGFQSVHKTDDLPAGNPNFVKVDPVELTPALLDVLGDLTRWDDILFAAAAEEFDRRLAEENPIRPCQGNED